jgi:sec-independent protein translocase protein TatA
MNVMLAGMIGGWEMVVILAVILMLFGARKLPELAKGLGQGIKEFKKATREVTDEVTNAMDDNPPQPQRRLPASTPTPAPTVQTTQVEPTQTVPQSAPGSKA